MGSKYFESQSIKQEEQMILEVEPATVVPYVDYKRHLEGERQWCREHQDDDWDQVEWANIDFDPEEQITVFDITRVVDVPGYRNRGFRVYDSREAAERSLSRHNPGSVFVDGCEIPFHWEIHENKNSVRNFLLLQEYDSDTAVNYPEEYYRFEKSDGTKVTADEYAALVKRWAVNILNHNQ
jgi:hypothetical protein